MLYTDFKIRYSKWYITNKVSSLHGILCGGYALDPFQQLLVQLFGRCKLDPMVCFELGNSSIGTRLTQSRNRGRCEAHVVMLAPCKEHRLIDDVVLFGDIYPMRN